MMLHAIAAMGKNRQIGLKGYMPWANPEELRHFQKTTKGGILIMGRKTWESIGKELTGRKTIVISRKKKENTKNTFFVKTPEEAIELASFVRIACQKVWVCGGQKIYEHFLPDIGKITLSVVEYDGKADTFFPEFEKSFIENSMTYNRIGKFKVHEWERFKNG